MELEICEALQRSDLLFIDVRSPGEYAESSIPNAINIPLFDDQQHQELGIFYHQFGEAKARYLALKMVAPKLPALVEEIAIACRQKTPLLYCKRGGMRSISVYQILTLTGIQALRLKGGYKAYRRHVKQQLGSYQLQKKIYVLHGLTGVGKTAVIHELIKKGIPAIDLEGLARHRGSVFGGIGLNEPRSQKDFDAQLLEQLDYYSGSPYLVVEGEGRRIGNTHLPLFLIEAMQEGCQLLLATSLNNRVKRIRDMYIPAEMPPEIHAQIKTALSTLRRRLSNATVDRLLEQLDQGDYSVVIETLCTDYYDHFYSDSRPECSAFHAVIDSSDAAEAALQIMDIINSIDHVPSLETKGVLTR
ncbi:MAG TPA: tRNA 2-selenouridine(34) synthase MnmH [Candidatus Limnocylindrales bacterium]|nr:tRNA 2-selenouridine(34) synthase MnmH [Candidatus Limnocylindrales bacterium]